MRVFLFLLDHSHLLLQVLLECEECYRKDNRLVGLEVSREHMTANPQIIQRNKTRGLFLQKVELVVGSLFPER